MADRVASNKIVDGHHNLIYHFTNVSDATGEADVVKVDVSALNAGPNGKTCAKVAVDRISYRLSGSDGSKKRPLTIAWVGTATDTEIVTLPANSKGELDYRDFGGLTNNAASPTGDISFTFPAATGGSYAVTMEMRKKY